MTLRHAMNRGPSRRFATFVLALAFALPAAAAPAAGPAVEYAASFDKGLPPDIRLQSEQGAGMDQDRPALFLAGQGLTFANVNRCLATGEFSGRLRLADAAGPDYWVGFQWCTRVRGGNSLSDGGYFVTIRQDGSAYFHEGPWTAASRTTADARTGLDPSKGIAFRVVFSGGRHEVFLDGTKVFSVEDATWPVGYCGVIAYTAQKISVAVTEERVAGKGLPVAAIPGPIARPAEAARAVGEKETVAVGPLVFSLAYVPGKVFPARMDDAGLGKVPYDYLIGDTEVTYELWKAVYEWATDPLRGDRAYSLGNRGWQGAIPGSSIPPQPFGTPRHPATMFSWRTAVVWCNALTEWYAEKTGARLDCVYYEDAAYTRPLRDSRSAFKIEPRPGSDDLPYIKADTSGNLSMEACAATGFRLPTHAEWELAARFIADRDGDGDILGDGEYTPGTFAAGASAGMDDAAATQAMANYKDNSGDMTLPVASKAPTALGLHDMSGNVNEWLFDGDPGAARPYRTAIGGAWNSPARECTVGGWFTPTPSFYNSWWGLRIARNVSATPPAATGRELLVNGDFTDGPVSWGVWFDPANSAGLADLASGAATIEVAKGGSVQLGYRGRFPVTAGLWYRLSFELSGTVGHKVSVELGESGEDLDKDGDVWTRYYGADAAIAAERKILTFIFRMDRSSPGLRVNFHVGDALDATTTVDSVSLRQVDAP